MDRRQRGETAHIKGDHNSPYGIPPERWVDVGRTHKALLWLAVVPLVGAIALIVIEIAMRADNGLPSAWAPALWCWDAALILLAGWQVVQSRVRKREAERWLALIEASPRERALWSYPWDRTGMLPCDGRHDQRDAATAVFLSLAIGGLCMPALLDPSAAFRVVGIGGIALTMLGVTYTTAVRPIVRKVRQRGGSIRFTRFPYHLGVPMAVTFLTDRSLPAGTVLHCTLQCRVQERGLGGLLPDDTDADLTPDLGGWVTVHREDVSAVVPDGAFAQQAEVTLHFDLPEEVLMTSSMLRDEGPVWELAVRASRGLLGFRATFPLPVYLHDEDRPFRYLGVVDEAPDSHLQRV